MLASLNFIDKFISLPKKTHEVVVNGRRMTKTLFDTDQIAPILTRQGFEVESMRQFGGEFDTVVVGRIENLEEHYDAKRLKVCFVNINDPSGLRQIVCGANNVRKGMYVAVALPGTKLPAQSTRSTSPVSPLVSTAGSSLDPAVEPRGPCSRGKVTEPRDDITYEIQTSIIRNVKSDGMICARSELGLSINSEVDGNGIWDLGDDAQGGASSLHLENYLGFPAFTALNLEDTLLELNVTPNRPDMLSQRGVARELAAGFFYNEIPFEIKNFNFSANSEVSPKTILNDASKNSHGSCGNLNFEAYNYLQANAFFVLIEMSHTQNKTPGWLRNLLEPLNQNSINLIVDISNFILVAYGQPNHAFDLDSIDASNPSHKKLILRHAHAHANEIFMALDGKERMLHEADCIVADSTTPQALLGVVGGEYSKITHRTLKIVVEFANPNPTLIRHTARRHAKHTVASFMFEKGIDAAERFHAAAEFFALLSLLMDHKVKYCSTVHSKNSDNYPTLQTEFQKIELPFHQDDQKKILGVDLIPYAKQLEILNSLGFEIIPIGNQDVARRERAPCILARSAYTSDEQRSHILISDGYISNHHNTIIAIPSWRSADVTDSADLVEECIRVIGMDNIPPVPMNISAVVNKDDPHLSLISKLCNQLYALGYHEVAGLHFMREDDFKKLNLSSFDALGVPIALLNPVIGDEPLLQTTLIPDLLRKVERNLSYDVKSGQLFHSARTFQKLNHENFLETKTLSGVCFGDKIEKTWENQGSKPWSLHDIMMHVKVLAETLDVKIKFIQTSENPFAQSLHPKKCVEFFVDNKELNQKPIGFLGALHPKVKRNYGLSQTDVYLFEINIENLIKAHEFFKHMTKKQSPLPKYQLISRDFSFIFDDNISAETIEKCVQNALKDMFANVLFATLKTVQIFDIYRGDNVPENKKSVTFKVIVEPQQKTFTDHEIQIFSTCIIEELRLKLSGEQRT